MLRVTVHDNPDSTTFQLEGTLVGPWVQVAKECWQRTQVSRRAGQTTRFDLAGLTSIDAAGKEFLRAMHSEGAELLAYGCLTRAIVAELADAPTRGERLRRRRAGDSDPEAPVRDSRGTAGAETGTGSSW